MAGLVRVRSLAAFRSADGAYHEGGSWFLVDSNRALELRAAGHPLADEIDSKTAAPPARDELALLEAAFAPAAPVEDEVPQVAPVADVATEEV